MITIYLTKMNFQNFQNLSLSLSTTLYENKGNIDIVNVVLTQYDSILLNILEQSIISVYMITIYLKTMNFKTSSSLSTTSYI
jgi:hypothetical protein